MSRFKSKQEFIDNITRERAKLAKLLDSIPENRKLEEVTDGMSVKDFLAHRTEWGRMMLSWYKLAIQGKQPAVPHEKYKWNQLNELNADIHQRFKDVPLNKIEKEFTTVHDELLTLIQSLDEKTLLEKNQLNFTGTSDLATYFNSATGGHYRSAYKYINKWWEQQG